MSGAGEQALVFDCEGSPLVGILSGGAVPASRGVLIVVGGPQYRAGSHRQFTLMARYLAAVGIPALRFDYRGMGDGAGEPRTFERVHADIRCAIDRFFASAPGMTDIVIWGLCDAASAALFYAHQDPRVSGLVLLNPWVHTEQGIARVYLRHYYWKRLLDADLWKKIGRGEFSFTKAAGAFHRLLLEAIGTRPPAAQNDPGAGGSVPSTSDAAPLPRRMEEGLRRFRGKVLLILSGNDYTAQEFKDLSAASRSWRRLIASERVTRHDLAAANHTFSRREWRDQVARWTAAWVKSW